MQKLLQLKKDYEREGFHLQRLYKRRIPDSRGVMRSTFGRIMEPVNYSSGKLEETSYRARNIIDYNELINKPKIESRTLVGDKTFEELGLQNISLEELDEILTDD